MEKCVTDFPSGEMKKNVADSLSRFSKRHWTSADFKLLRKVVKENIKDALLLTESWDERANLLAVSARLKQANWTSLDFFEQFVPNVDDWMSYH